MGAQNNLALPIGLLVVHTVEDLSLLQCPYHSNSKSAGRPSPVQGWSHLLRASLPPGLLGAGGDLQNSPPFLTVPMSWLAAPHRNGQRAWWPKSKIANPTVESEPNGLLHKRVQFAGLCRVLYHVGGRPC